MKIARPISPSLRLGFGTPSSEFLSILSSGDIGIGTATPGAKLEVAGNIKIVDGTQ